MPCCKRHEPEEVAASAPAAVARGFGGRNATFVIAAASHAESGGGAFVFALFFFTRSLAFSALKRPCETRRARKIGVGAFQAHSGGRAFTLTDEVACRWLRIGLRQ